MDLMTFNKTVFTGNAVDWNRPDIVVGAKRRKVSTLIKVRISSQANFKEILNQQK